MALLSLYCAHGRNKRGILDLSPDYVLQIDAIGQLPKAKQKFVVEMIDTVLAQHAL